MKILVLTHRSNFSGGANRSLLAILQGLKERGHEIDVILPKKCGELNDALSAAGIPWWHCQYYRMGAKPLPWPFRIVSYGILYGKFFHHLFKGWEISRKIKDGGYDVVYTNTILPYCGLFAAKKLGIPSVIHDREPLDGTAVPQIVGYETFLYHHADKIIVISRDLQQQWARRGMTEHIVLIHNGIPLQQVVLSDQRVEQHFNLLLTARIAPMKHHLDALEALARLKDQGISNIKLYFAGSEGEKGDAAYRKTLQSYIADHALQDDVVFLGEVADMGQLRAKMHVELMCNPEEPFGRVTVEGMRSGLVVIGVDAGGTKDILLHEQNGLLYEKGNIADLAEKVKRVYSDEGYRKQLAAKAAEYGRTHFTIEENVSAVETVLKEVQAGK